MKRNAAPQVERRVALCYIRLSQTKNESDLKSPERQKANLQAACDKYGRKRLDLLQYGTRSV